MNRRRVVAYIFRSGENRDGQDIREIEVQRDDKNGRTIRRYHSTPRRRDLVTRAARNWDREN